MSPWGPPRPDRAEPSRNHLTGRRDHPVVESRHMRVATLPASLLACRTVMWTPHVLTTRREPEREVELRCGGLTDDIESAFHPDYDPK